MPHLTILFTQGAPVIDLVVSASGPRLRALAAAGRALPDPQTVRALIDTGASHTCIDPSVLKALGLQPTGNVAMLTPSTGATPMSADTYDVGLVIPNGTQPGLMLHNIQVSAAQLLLAQGIHALIGRDILAQCVLIANGSNGMMTLAY